MTESAPSRRASDAVAQVLGTIRLRRHWELEALMDQVHNPLARVFGSRDARDATLDFIAHQLAADREAKRSRLREWLASARFAEEV